MKNTRKKQHTLLIDGVQQTITECKEQIAFVREHSRYINKVSTTARHIDPNAYVYVSSRYVYITVHVKDLNGFKESKLLRAMQKLEKVSSLEFNSSRDYAEGGERYYEATGDVITLRVYAVLGSAPKHCTKVITGTRHVEIPQYQLICR